MGLHISASGILNALRRQELTANNVANLRTPGYRASRAINAETAGGGVSVGSVSWDNSAGGLETIGRPLDTTASNGFFRVETPGGGTAYTRDGSFGLNAEGEVVTSGGARLSPPVRVPDGATGVTVNGRGEVFATLPGEAGPQRVGALEVFSFPNPGGLESLGGNLYGATPAAGEPHAVSARTDFLPGTLAASYTNLVREQVNTALNLHQAKANINAFRAQDEVLGSLIDISR